MNKRYATYFIIINYACIKLLIIFLLFVMLRDLENDNIQKECMIDELLKILTETSTHEKGNMLNLRNQRPLFIIQKN